MRYILVVAMLLGAAGCHDCRWVSHGVCVTVDDDSVITDKAARDGWTDADWQIVLDATISQSLAFWSASDSSIDGWTIVLYKDSPSCYGGKHAGCVMPLTREIRMVAVPLCPTAFIPHELGHATHPPSYDPGHWRGGWDKVEREQFQIARCWPG
jgi:hypothetical protein